MITIISLVLVVVFVRTTEKENNSTLLPLLSFVKIKNLRCFLPVSQTSIFLPPHLTELALWCPTPHTEISHEKEVEHQDSY